MVQMWYKTLCTILILGIMSIMLLKLIEMVGLRATLHLFIIVKVAHGDVSALRKHFQELRRRIER